MELRRSFWTAGLIAAVAGAATVAQQTQPGTQPGTQPPTRQPRTQPPTREQPGQPTQPGRETPGRDTQTPGMRQPGQERVNPAELDRMTANWPEASRKAIRELVSKYGPPNAATPMMVVWRDNGPWKYTVVHAAEVQHNFPMPHTDVLEQFVEYKVPADKVDDLAQFDGSIVVARTPGLVGAWCDNEAANFLALNLAHEILEGTKTVEEARQFFAQEAANLKQGKTSTYTQGLMFEVERGRTADPDKPVTPGATPRPATDRPGTERPGMPGEQPGRTPRPGEQPGTPRPGESPRPGQPNQPG